MTTLSTKNKNKTSKPPRPYTEYNIFFQLEREYILQTLYLVVPIFDSKDAFDCSDVNYHGPPLPSKYSDLVLPKDWFVPGKARRRKRSHRKSHGKISFSDLSKKISSHWRNVNDETRLFCSQVSAISMMAYYKDRQTNHANELPVYTAKKSRGPNKPETGTNRHLGLPHITAIDSGSNVCFNPMKKRQEEESSITSSRINAKESRNCTAKNSRGPSKPETDNNRHLALLHSHDNVDSSHLRLPCTSADEIKSNAHCTFVRQLKGPSPLHVTSSSLTNDEWRDLARQLNIII